VLAAVTAAIINVFEFYLKKSPEKMEAKKLYFSSPFPTLTV
jgi:hypothetical protein